MDDIKIWPLTIMLTRYNGVYEGGKWAAFNLSPAHIPAEAHGNDVTCATWWDYLGSKIAGVGNTPEEAVENLKPKIEFHQAYWRA